VWRFAGTITVIALASGAVACGGGIFFISTSDDGVIFFTASGTVSVVQLTIINGSQVTVVTLIDTGAAQTFNFCGNVVAQFPTNTFVKATYRHNGDCDSVMHVAI
jgi:DUF4097 and DUF4098 domain-containing protein YvlB